MARWLWRGQLFCPSSQDADFLLYEVQRRGQQYDWGNAHPANVGVAVAVNHTICPAFVGRFSGCLFLGASSLSAHTPGFVELQLGLTVGFRSSVAPPAVKVYLLDDGWETLCRHGAGDDFWGMVGGYYSFPPSSASEALRRETNEVTTLLLQLTRRRELVVGGQRWGPATHTTDRNTYKVVATPNIGSTTGRCSVTSPRRTLP
jgi:hypothetical protein